MPHRKRILVVEDEHINQEILSIYLSGIYKLDYAEKLDDAITLIDSHTYNFIITDIRLGHCLDGLNVLKHARESAHNAATPVFAYTASETSINQRSFVEEGFDGVISKPINREHMMNTLAKF